jgi:hypothetical protein
VSRGELTPEAKEIYLKSSGDHCPYCGVMDLEGGAIEEVDGGCAWQEIRCIECHTLWHDVYQLVDMVPADKVPGGPETKRRRASGKPAAEVSSRNFRISDAVHTGGTRVYRAMQGGTPDAKSPG